MMTPPGRLPRRSPSAEEGGLATLRAEHGTPESWAEAPAFGFRLAFQPKPGSLAPNVPEKSSSLEESLDSCAD